MWTKSTSKLFSDKGWVLGSIVALYLVIAALYLVATPPLESSDEYKHYPVVQQIATNHTLVVVDPDRPGLWQQDGAQPPLYYLLMAMLIAPIDTTDLNTIYQLNKHAFIGDPNQIRNKNLLFHRPEQERFPAQGGIRAIYVIRIASILLGVGTIIFGYLVGKTLFGREVGWFAATLTAFNPMFLFTSAAVNNDSLANLLGALILYQLVQLWRNYEENGRRRGQLIFLGILLGLGMVTKLSLGGLLGLTGLAMAWQAWRQRRWQILFVDGVLVATLAFALASPMFLFNWIHYRDITALNVFVAVQGTRSTPMTWHDWVGEFGSFYRSFWGLFGGVNIAAPELFYNVCNGLALLGIIGAAADRKPRWVSSGAWLVVAWALIIFGLLLRWTLIYQAFQGRLLFPALTAINLLLAMGLYYWLRHWRGGWIGVAGLFCLAAALIPTVIRPNYILPQPLTALPKEVEFGPITFSAEDGTIALVGLEMAKEQTVTAGGLQPVDLTLYWQAITPVNRNYLSTLHLLGRNLQSIAQINRHPAWGMIPTSRWQAGQIWRDEYRLFPSADALTPNQTWVKVELFDTNKQKALPMSSADGQPITLLRVGTARLKGKTPIEPPAEMVELNKLFGDGILLKGYQIDSADSGQMATITLTWQAENVPTQDYTVFVQLLDEKGVLHGSADAPPLTTDLTPENYPTSWWQKGDVIVDRHEMAISAELPPGNYQIAVGLYNNTYRLPLTTGGDSVRLPFVLDR